MVRARHSVGTSRLSWGGTELLETCALPRGLFHCPDERVAARCPEIAGARRRLRATGCGRRAGAGGRGLAPVRVAADREIRTVVGLRPFRASGFCVRADRLGEKLVVHNYGHGRSGVTMSWGTADLAAQLALDAPARNIAVIGAGAVGGSPPRACCSCAVRV